MTFGALAEKAPKTPDPTDVYGKVWVNHTKTEPRVYCTAPVLWGKLHQSSAKVPQAKPRLDIRCSFLLPIGLRAVHTASMLNNLF